MKTPKRVLFITYNFPPHGGSGVQRSTKFVKYLPEFGWQPVVVTSLIDASLVSDKSLLSDISAKTSIYRVPGFSIEKLQRHAKQFRVSKLVTVLNLLLQIPDASRFWANNVYKHIEAIIHTEKPSMIYTTSGPYSSHMVGMWIKQHFHLPWFADFRDPWSQNLLIPYLPGYRTINRRLEYKVLATANKVCCVSEPWLADLKKNLLRQYDKFMVLPNGYDEEDIQPLPMSVHTNRFTLAHIGSFYRNRRPEQFIKAIDLLIDSGRIPASELRILFIGKNSHQHIPKRSPYEAQSYLPHKELDHLRMHTNVFLLILDTSSNNVGNHSAKLFEYLASNRPILGIVPPDGVAEQLIKKTQTGLTVGSEISAIADAVETLYYQWRDNEYNWNPNWDVIRQYTRRNLTIRLAAEFDQLVERRQE